MLLPLSSFLIQEKGRVLVYLFVSVLFSAVCPASKVTGIEEALDKY